MKSVLLLGDSITQQGYCSGWVSNVSDALVRRAYVVNSGLSGYNTRWVRDYLKDPNSCEAIIPKWVDQPLFATLMLGSNDCADGGQHVPLEEYKANLKEIVEILLTEVKPEGGVFVLTPPPIHETAWNENHTKDRRYYAEARKYRQGALAAIKELEASHPDRVFPVDIQRAFLQYGAPAASEADMDRYDPQGPWVSLLLEDGLHINKLGGQLFSATLLNAVRLSPHGAQALRNDEATWPLPDWEAVMERYASKEH